MCGVNNNGLRSDDSLFNGNGNSLAYQKVQQIRILQPQLPEFGKRTRIITSSSGVISKKYLKDMSKWDRSTTSTSETSYMVLSNRYLNMRMGLSAMRPLFEQYLFTSSS